MEKFVEVGKVKDAHGIRGELFVVLFAAEAAWLQRLETLRLVDAKGVVTNVAVKSARPHKNGLIVKSNDIKDRNRAEEMKGWVLEIPEDYLVSKPGEAMYLREIQGFRVMNAGELVGTIEAFSSNTAQDLLVVRNGTQEFEIPFVKAFVESIDETGRIIHMILPEGLVNLESVVAVGTDAGADAAEAEHAAELAAATAAGSHAAAASAAATPVGAGVSGS